MKVRHWMFLFVLLVTPILMGGYGHNDGCGGDCGGGDDWDEPERPAVVAPEPDAEESAAVPDECLIHIDDALRAAAGPQKPCQTCVIDDDGLSEMERELKEARAELARIKARLKVRTEAPSKKSPRLLDTVTVKRGWWMGKYVKATPGATLKATRACNGFTARNPKVHPGQRLKICGW